MEPSYRESRMILPKNLAIIAALMLIASYAAILVTDYFYDCSSDAINIACGVVFLIAIVICFALRFTTEIYGDRIELKYIVKKTVIPFEQIIETKTGELNIIKSYTAWSLKGVKYHTYSAVGEDMGVGLKVTGKRVYYFSTTDPDTVASLLPKGE